MEQQVKDDIQRVFQLQKKQQKALRASTAEQRREKLQRFLDSVIAHEEEIIEAIRKDVRKPYHEVKKAEIEGTKKAIRDNMNNLEQWMAPKEVGSSLSPDANGILMYEPKDVTLILGPWNYPFMLTMAPLAASLAAGNSAIVKLSDFTMNTSNIAAKVIRDAFDEKEVAIFEGEVEVATELLDQPFDHIFFTGSTNVGKIVMTAAAKHLASVTLELGGKSPTIIDSEYDLMDAAKKIAVGKFVNAGQTCIAPDYLFIKKDVQDKFAGILQTVVNAGFMEDDHTPDRSKFTQIVNDRDKPLALYVFSKKQDMIDNVLQHTTSGNAAINDVVVHFSDVNLPFGGVNTSGIGSYHGVYGFKEFSHEKGVFIQASK
ncbi:aldehyde dehydrogenase family protein [Bacillus subtilis]|nr:aldehyde dehydrogenase family protein [Bacillus subtilis]WGE03398.1 aldehyde dehydrogenase family protein [Bacillus subtilis]